MMVESKRLKNWTIAIAVVLLPVGFVRWCSVRDNRLVANFSQVTTGMTMDQVRAVMGDPTWDTRCGEKVSAYTRPPGCNRQMTYSVTLAPLNPDYYLVWFGVDGKVIGASRVASP